MRRIEVKEQLIDSMDLMAWIDQSPAGVFGIMDSIGCTTLLGRSEDDRYLVETTTAPSTREIKLFLSSDVQTPVTP